MKCSNLNITAIPKIEQIFYLKKVASLFQSIEKMQETQDYVGEGAHFEYEQGHII